MQLHSEEIRERLHFIDRTIFNAVRACEADRTVPDDLRTYISELGEHSSHAQHALRWRDEGRVRQSVADLARISDEAQTRIHPTDGVNYDLKSAVILTHIEVSALRLQLGQNA